jgi:transcriptional regulator MraZ
LVFTGTHDHTIDKKNRLAIPAYVRTKIKREAGEPRDWDESIVLYVTLGTDEALCLYTEKGYEKRAEELDHSQMDTQALIDYEAIFYAMTQEVEIDKQGRVTLPSDLLERSGLSSEVVLIGVKDHLEIRDRKTWYEKLNNALKDRPEILRNPRLAMGPKQIATGN